MSRSDAGLWVTDPVATECKPDVDDKALGEWVLATLGQSRERIVHPTAEERAHLSDNLLRLAGVNTWNSFAREASDVHIDESDDSVRIEIWPRLVEQGRVGFGGPGPDAHVLASPTAEALGRELRAAIEHAIAIDNAAP